MAHHFACSTIFCRRMAAAIAICISLGQISFAVAADATQPSAVQRIPEVDGYDFGVVLPGVQIAHIFRLRNDLGVSETVRRARTSCGCTAVSVTQNTLDAGASIDVTAYVSTGRQIGKHKVYLVLEMSSRGGIQLKDFALEFNVVPVITLSEDDDEVNLGECSLSEVKAQRSIIVHRGPYPMKWDELTATTTSNVLDARLVRRDSDTWQLTIVLRMSAEIGGFAGDVVLSVERDGRPTGYTIRKHVTAIIQGPIVVRPATWLIGSTSVGQSISKVFVISGNDSDGTNDSTNANSIVVEDIRSSDPQIVGVERDPNQPARFTATYRAPLNKGPDQGEIVVRVRSNKEYTIRVPYLAFVIGR